MICTIIYNMKKKVEEEFGVDRALTERVEKFPKVAKVLKLLKTDDFVSGLIDQANKVAIVRMGYNDHGPMHARIAAYNSLKILDLLHVEPTVVSEGIGDLEDSMVAVVMGAFFHDCGISLVREGHELMGMIVSRDSIVSILSKIYNDRYKVARLASIVSECILCHMGTYKATSWEAKIVETADGTDASKGRARIPFHIAKPDIHKFSALAIEKINIVKGEKKPIRFEVLMDNPAGIFQAEAIMLKKTIDAEMDKYVEIVAKIRDQEPIVIL